MGNTGGREKGRHISGDDLGPTMRMSLDLDESSEFSSGVLKVKILFLKGLFWVKL